VPTVCIWWWEDRKRVSERERDSKCWDRRNSNDRQGGTGVWGEKCLRKLVYKIISFTSKPGV